MWMFLSAAIVLVRREIILVQAPINGLIKLWASVTWVIVRIVNAEAVRFLRPLYPANFLALSTKLDTPGVEHLQRRLHGRLVRVCLHVHPNSEDRVHRYGVEFTHR